MSTISQSPQDGFRPTPDEMRLMQVWRAMKDGDRRATMIFAEACVEEDPRRPPLRLVASARVTS